VNNTSFTLSNARRINWQVVLPWVVFFTGMLYYCFAYLLRVYPSVMEDQLLARFNVSVRAFGFLTGFYYFAYAPMQLIVGMTVDYIGARRSLLLGCLIAILGVSIFAQTTVFDIALAGRFFIGLGAAFGYVTALKIATQWLPRRYFATAAGMVTGGGMIAAGLTDKYLTYLIHTKDFYSALHFPLYVGVFLFLYIFLTVRSKPPVSENISHHHVTYPQLLSQLWGIMKRRQMWLIGVIGALLYLPASVFVDAWGIPFLTTARHFTPEQAAQGMFVVLIGWVLSSFISGMLSDRFHTRKIPLVISAIGATIIAFAIIFLSISSVWILYTLLFLLGVFCGPHPLCFALSKENCSMEIAGTAVSFANFLIMSGGMLMQPLVGIFLSLLKHGEKLPPSAYSSFDFSVALSIIPIGLLIALCSIAYLKETFGRHN